jgi:hypothetical protein
MKKAILTLFALILVLPLVSATDFSGNITLSAAPANITLADCVWNFYALQSGDDWLYVQGLTVTGSKTIDYEITKNYTDLQGEYSCTSFPYPTFSDVKSQYGMDALMSASTSSLLLIVGFFSLFIVVAFGAVAMGLLMTGRLEMEQFVQWIFTLVSVGFLIGLGIIIFAAMGAL